MITAILIILSFAVNFTLLVLIKQQQEISHSILYKIQHDMWDTDITQIRKTVRAIDKKIEDSTVYKTELRFVDNKKD